MTRITKQLYKKNSLVIIRRKDAELLVQEGEVTNSRKEHFEEALHVTTAEDI